MRVQMDILKQKLDNQNIVNQSNLKRMIRQGVNSMNRDSGIILVLISMGVILYLHAPLYRQNLGESSLVHIAEKVSRLKKVYAVWPRYAAIPLLIWIGWLLYEINLVCGELNVPLTVGLLVGVLLGWFIGFCSNQKMIKSADELLDQIHDLQRQ